MDTVRFAATKILFDITTNGAYSNVAPAQMLCAEKIIVKEANTWTQ